MRGATIADAAGRLLERGNTTLGEAEAEEDIRYLTLALFFSTLVLSQLLLYVSRKLQQTLVPEAGILLVLGMAIGAMIKGIESANSDAEVVTSVQKLTEFDSDLFFLILLPPIIFDSGYTIRRGLFFGNFGLILSLAIFGTFIASLGTALILFAATNFGLYPASGMECVIFGALISATDPVTVISVFNRVGVKPSLQVLVFGESVLNDAVAIVLYQTMVFFQEDDDEDLNTISALEATLQFIKILLGSVFIGVLIGGGTSIMFKWLHLFESDTRHLEATLSLVIPYVTYSLAAGLELSGIVSILFTGIAMASYTRLNLSDETGEFLGETYSVLAHMAETFVFVYLGMAVFTGDMDWSLQAVVFGFVAFGACLVARAIAVVPICMLSNWSRRPHERVSMAEIFVLWFSGLRGGMAFALAVGSVDEINKTTGRVFVTSTTIIIMLTVFLFGGTVESLCTRLRLVEKDAASPLASPLGPGAGPRRPEGFAGHGHGGRALNDVGCKGSGCQGLGESEIELSSITFGNASPPRAVSPAVSSSLERGQDSKESFWTRFDRAVLTPILVRQDHDSATVRDVVNDEAFEPCYHEGASTDCARTVTLPGVAEIPTWSPKQNSQGGSSAGGGDDGLDVSPGSARGRIGSMEDIDFGDRKSGSLVVLD